MSTWPPGENEAREKFGDDFVNLHIDSKISISKAKALENVDPVVVPIYQTTTYRFATVAQWDQPNHGSNYVYSRCGNPTVENVEVIVSELEGAAATLVYNSGLAAVSALLLEFLSAGDHVVCMKPLYSGSYSFMTETMIRFGVTFTFVDVEKEKDFVGAVEKAIKENTKLIYLEAIANPSMAVPDILEVVEVKKRHTQTKLVVDATFASPYLLQSLKIGADFALHSGSKYIGGHCDVIAGCISCGSLMDWQRLKTQQLTTGSALSPMDAALLTRGLKTLALRMDKISETAQKVAKYLDEHRKVIHTFYPGLRSHPQHEAAKKLFPHGKFSGMIGFDVGSAEKAIKLIENLRLITLAVSLGGTESLIEHPFAMSHGKQLLRAENEEAMVAPGLLRFSIGVENAVDLIADLERALQML
ncbi:unnamed protein product, partial [Mesorhabditis belari]|uniref:Cystathionine gamma-lyase n=1 Tax=Mesorhabditis belari TaxID=2138241 RepID=A0AAF3FEM6_9BILA